MSEAARSLGALHRRIEACERCWGRDGELRHGAPRAFEGDEKRARLAVVAEALGPKTQRLTGRPYTDPDDTLSPAGQILETELLGPLGLSLKPRGGAGSVYSTDSVHCWPAQASDRGLKTRKPDRSELRTCAEWIDQELLLLRPIAVVLLGRPATQEFLCRHLDLRIDRLAAVDGRRHDLVVDGHHLAVFPAFHPSAVNYGQRDAVLASYRRLAREIQPILGVL